jgi:periplasmic copper chaperone A
MNTLSRMILSAALAVALGMGIAGAQSSGPISIEKPFSRATPGGSKAGAGYMTIVNKGGQADRLVSVSSPAAGKVEIHEMTMQDGVMKMRELANGLPIEAGKSASLAPHGTHLMMMDLKAPLKEGDKVPLTLNFEKAGKIEVTLDVQAIGAQQPGGGMHMHNM